MAIKIVETNNENEKNNNNIVRDKMELGIVLNRCCTKKACTLHWMLVRCTI